MICFNLSDKEEKIAKAVVNAAYTIHKKLGPGLLESVYEVCFCYELEKVGFKARRQVPIPIIYENIVFTINTTPPNPPDVDIPVDDSYVKDELFVSGTTDDGVEKVIIYINANKVDSFDVSDGEYSGVIDISDYDAFFVNN